jgi:hypothetical protein
MSDVMAEPPHTFSRFSKHHLIINSSRYVCVQCTHDVPASHVVGIGQIWGTARGLMRDILLAM